MKFFFNLLEVVKLIEPHGKICCGAVGTIVEQLNEDTYLVEFCDKEGRVLEVVPISERKISKLKQQQSLVAA